MSISQELLDNNLPLLGLDEKKELHAKAIELAVQQASEHFLPFIELINPRFVRSRHHEIIAEHLEAVERGEIKRLMVFMPPRASKSFMISEYYPAWFMGRNSTKQVLAVSYGITLAEDFGRKVRNIINTDDYRRIFPTVSISSDSRAAAKWHTTDGGVYNAAGVTGGIAGKGAHLGLIDDPLNEQDSFSKARRDHVINWYPGGFTSRLMPGGRVVILMTRWHEDDLAGHLLSQIGPGTKNPWTILSIPAILDEDGAALLDLPKDGTFWPVKDDCPEDAELKGWPLEELLDKRQGPNPMPPYQWEALYMQQPIAEEGNILKRNYWSDWVAPDPPELEYTFLSCDTAFSTKSSADFSALVTWGVFRNEDNVPQLICLGSEKGRWEYPDLRNKIIDKYEYHNSDCILIEKQASGQSLIQDLYRAGLPVVPYQPDKDKVSRAHACTPLLLGGRVWIPFNKGWASELINECSSFPSGRHDDLVDATTQAILWVKDGMLVTHPRDPWEDKEDTPKKSRRGYY